MKTAKALWDYASEKGLRPLPKTSVSTWADNYRVLSSGVSAEPGRWKTSRAPYQKEIMDAFTQPGVSRVVVMSSSQIGKALALDTPIPTPDGWKNMGDLCTGDTVFDEDGKTCHVVACTAVQKDRPCYELTFSDGSKIVADENHEWQVQIDGEADCIRTTGEMAKDFKQGKRNKYAIPVAESLKTESNKELPLDPYVLGVWLGDGNSYSAQITMHRGDLFIANRMKEKGYEVVVEQREKRKKDIMLVKFNPYHPEDPICRRGHDKRITGYTKAGHCSECARQQSLHNKWKGIKDIRVDPVVYIQKTGSYYLHKLDVHGNKHIPPQYLRATENDRWELLRGIMDTDGSVSKRGRCEITLKSRKLILGVSELLHTLGIKHTLKARNAICTNSPTRQESKVWRISFMTYSDKAPFSLPRKQERIPARDGRRTTETERRRIVDISFIGYRDTRCIEVDSPSHLYLAGRAMIPTHNSDVMNNVIGRFAHLDPCAIMMIQPTIDMANDYSKSRVAPMIRDTRVLSGLFYNIKENTQKEAKTRDGNNTILSKIFPGGRLIMCGANSPAGLASRPVRILLADEVDRFPESAGGEGDPVDLAAKRMTTFWNRVMGLFSTPTNEGESRIADEYQTGTQEEWQYECPNCGEYHALRYVDIKTEHTEHKDRKGRKIVVVEDVRWVCPDCGYAFSEQQIKSAPQKYVAQNPEAIKNGIRSFWVNAFSSPWLSWKELMREWLEAKGDPNREKVVVNTRFGEPYALGDVTADATPLMRRREQYNAPIPDGVLLLTAAVDVQDNRLEYEVCGWGFGEECWGIVRGMILSRPDLPETWAELDAILDKVYTFQDGRGLKIHRTFIDSGGHYTGHVYEYCASRVGLGRFPIKGYSNRPGIPLVYKLGKETGCTVPLIILGVDDGKQQVFNRLAIQEIGDGYFHFGLDGDTDLNYRGYDEIYFKGLLSEEKRLVKRNGTLKNVWVPKSGVRNEPLDLRVYNLAAMQSCKVDWGRQYEMIYDQKASVEMEHIPDAVVVQRKKSKPRKLPKRPKNRFSRKNELVEIPEELEQPKKQKRAARHIASSTQNIY